MSYITLSAAKAWVAAHVRSADRTSWDALTDSDKTIALQEAEDRIDDLPLRGRKYNIEVTAGVPDQQAEFPRIIDDTVVNWDDSAEEAIVPQDIKDAVCLEAVALCQVSDRKALQREGVQSFSIGGKLSETFRPDAGSEALISDRARRIMRRYIGAEVR